MNPGSYVFKFLLAVDVFFCALIYRDADVTISSECGLSLRHPKPGLWEGTKRALGRCLNAISTSHCESAIASDIARAKRAIAYLEGS